MKSSKSRIPIAIVRPIVLVFFMVTSINSIFSQAHLDFEPYDYWTGLQPDTITGGPGSWLNNQGFIYPNNTDGVLGATVSSPRLIGRRSCSDTLYRVYVSVDVTNNPLLSFDALTSMTRSHEEGNLDLTWDVNNFQEGEANKVTVTFDFEQVPFGMPEEPVTTGLSFPIDGYAGGHPGEVTNFRVYNGTSLVIEQNGITNSNQCAPLDAAGTSNGAKHFFEIPVGQPYTRLEIDLYKCNSNTGSVKLEFEEPTLPGATCNPSIPLGDCGEGYGYYLMSLDANGNMEVNTHEDYGFLYGGISFDVTQERAFGPDSLTKGEDRFENYYFNIITGGTDFAILERTGNRELHNGYRQENWTHTISQADTIVRTIDFCAPVDYPILISDKMMTGAGFFVYDCNDNPVPLRWIGRDESDTEGTTGFVDGNHVRLMTGGSGFANNSIVTHIRDEIDVSVEIAGSYDCLKIKIYNDYESRYRQGQGNNVFTRWSMGIVNCALLQEDPACNYDLYAWKSDTTAHQYVIRQSGTDKYYELIDSDFDANSVGDMLFKGAPVCGSLSFLQADVISSCPDNFVCPGGGGGDDSAVKIETVTPNGTGHLLDIHWQDINGLANPVTALYEIDRSDDDRQQYEGAQWHDITGPFGGPIDALGLPTYGANGQPSTYTPLSTDAMFGIVGAVIPDQTSNTSLVSINSYMQDGWLAIPPDLEAIELTWRGSGTGAVYIIEPGGNVVEVFDESYQFTNVNDDRVGIYCIDNPYLTFGAGWQLLRIRTYAHFMGPVNGVIRWRLPSNLKNPNIWYFNDFVDIPSNFIWPADSHTSLTPPASLLEDTLAIQYAIVDNTGAYWEPEGMNMPTTKIDFEVDLTKYRTITEISDCTDQPAHTVGTVTCEDVLMADFCQEITNCMDAIDNAVDICALLAQNPSNPLATEDCDEGGQTNEDECAAGNDPLDINDDQLPSCDPSTSAPTVSNGGN